MSKWKMVKLGEVCIIERGGSPRPISSYITDELDGVNWIKIGDAESDSMYINNTKEKIKLEGMKKSRFVKKGDFILSNSMSFGRPYILNIDGCIHDGWLLIRDNNNIFDKKFLYYSLSSPIVNMQFKKSAVGGVVNNLNSDIVRKTNVPFPPLEVQKHIADTLDKTQEIIDGHKKQLEELDNLIKATFYDMFGDPVTNEKNWEVKKMKEISSLITKGSSPNWQGIKYTEDSSQVLFVTSENVRGGYLNLDKPKYLEKKFNDIQKRSVLKYGDLLINIVGASIGRAAVYNLNKQANINQAVALVRCNKDINLIYICQYLNSPKAHIMYGEMQVDVARANLSLENIGDLEIIYPPLDLQNKFAQIVTKIEEQKSLVKQLITESQNLFNSLMSKYFD